jgi:AraC-like DNA-binding protein
MSTQDFFDSCRCIPSNKVMISLHPRLLYCGVYNGAPDKKYSHAHSFLEFIFIISGKGAVIIDGKKYNLKKGDLAVYNPHSHHREISDKKDPLKIYFVAVKNVKLNGFDENYILPKESDMVLSVKKQYVSLARYYMDLISECKKESFFTKEVSESLVRMILLLILRIITEKYDNKTDFVKTNRSFLKAKNYIDQNYAEINGLDKICAYLHISKYYLSHLFKEYHGQSPLQYAIFKKMELAKKLLRDTKLLVREVALKCGYEDTNYFCKVFKSLSKKTPSQYRHSTG